METITRDSLIDQLRQKGLKITPQRLAVVDAIVENFHSHPGAHLIYTEAVKKTKHVSLSTVYATLSEFCQQGLLRNLEFDRMENRYEGNLENHINLVCRRCGKITDYHRLSPFEPAAIAREEGFVITDARMEYYGYCRDCLTVSGQGSAAKPAGEKKS